MPDHRQKFIGSGIRISSDGKDLRHTLNTEDSFNSRFPNLKVVKVVTVSYTFGSNPGNGKTTILTIPHGLTYRPASRVQYEYSLNSGVWRFAPWIVFSQGDDFPGPNWWTLEQRVEYRMNATNLIIRYNRIVAGTMSPTGGVNMSGKTFNFKIYIFADPSE